MADTVQEPVAPPSSLSEHRAAKAARVAVSAAPPAEKQAPTAEPQGETAGTPAAPKQETQEKQEPKPRAKNAEERAAELRAAGRVKEAEKIEAEAAERKEFDNWKANKAQWDADQKELRELRNRKPPEPTQATPPPPAAAAPADNAPKLKDFLAKPENAGKTYDEVVEQWEEAKYQFRREKEKAENEASERRKTVDQKVDDLRKVHADVDVVFNSDNLKRINPVAVGAACHQINGGVAALYEVLSNPSESAKFAGMSPTEQIIELGVIARSLNSPPASTPEKPKPTPVPISHTPPPPRSLGGISPKEDIDRTKPPASFSDFKARKAAKTG